jgi:hypothetical protein
LGKITFFKKNKIQRKVFRKKTQLIPIMVSIFLKIFKNIKFRFKVKNLLFYKVYKKTQQSKIQNNIFLENTFVVNICQKKFNLKSTLSKGSNNVLNTFSVGSVIKYFKVIKGKYVRRSSKGTKVFLNFLKNLISKKYISCVNQKNNTIVVIFNGVNNNIILAQNTIKGFFVKKNINTFILINSRISFTKTKDKRIKAIKKRLKKKLISRSLFR